MTGALSDSVGQYQTVTDPGGVGSEALAPSLAGELERLRFCIKRLTGKTQWYTAPSANMDQTLNSVNAGTIAVGGATPLTLRRTENDTTERRILEWQLGSGVGNNAGWQVKGTGANDITEVSLLFGGVEAVRFMTSTALRWEPQGYLTPTAGVPIIIAGVVAATSVIYEPFKGALVPLIVDGTVLMKIFTPLTLTLNNPNHAADTLYDVYLWSDTGTTRIITGPAWANSTAGSCSRGAAADLTRPSHGLLVNNIGITGRNGAVTFVVPAQAATYIGTIMTDTVGTVTCNRDYGETRKWCIWNNYNKQPLYLKGGDSAASWSYTLNVIRAANGNANNRLQILSGLAEDFYELRLVQRIDYQPNTSNTILMRNGIGINSTAAFSGQNGELAATAGTAVNSGHRLTAQAIAQHFMPPSLGITNVRPLEIVPDADAFNTYYGTEANMLLTAKWMG